MYRITYFNKKGIKKITFAQNDVIAQRLEKFLLRRGAFDINIELIGI